MKRTRRCRAVRVLSGVLLFFAGQENPLSIAVSGSFKPVEVRGRCLSKLRRGWYIVRKLATRDAVKVTEREIARASEDELRSVTHAMFRRYLFFKHSRSPDDRIAVVPLRRLQIARLDSVAVLLYITDGMMPIFATLSPEVLVSMSRRAKRGGTALLFRGRIATTIVTTYRDVALSAIYGAR